MRRLLIALLLILLSATAHAAPKAKLWEKWQAHDPASQISVNHGTWDIFLKRYVIADPNGLNRFEYGGVDADAKKTLDAYIEALAGTPVSKLNRAEQLAYWINLYNALTVQVVLEHYPVETIRDIDISPGLFSDGPWSKKLVTIEGEPVGLDDIEHRILRPIWQDPRLHYAVNCASVGCPDLLARAYNTDDMDRTLTANAVAYINSSRGVAQKGGEISVSSIYDWFEADFGGNESGVLAHLRQYAKGDLLTALEKATDIDGYIYDWSLNGK